METKVAVAMSGGVDSSAAAWLLREQGWALAGVTMDLTGEGACAPAVRDARAVAEQLGIPHHTLALCQAFREAVIDPFVREYEAGRTPNPCVVCNRRLKFGALLERCRELGLDAVATGHYVRLDYDPGSGRYLLKKASHLDKDQSYVLYSLTQDQLAHSRFPLGALSKEEVRALALEAGLPCAHWEESQDICFIPDGDYGTFLRRYTGRDYPSGPYLDEAGSVLGRHTGIIDYTVGQRRGLRVSSNTGRLYVKEVRPGDNTVVLSDNAALYGRTLEANRLNLIPCTRLDGPVRLRAKIRYRMAEQPCTVEQTGEEAIRLVFDQPQRAITPGQTAVFYDGDTVVGGAIIERSMD